MEWFDWLAYILLIVGGLNWGLVAFFDVNLVTILSFGVGLIGDIIYGLVLVSAVYGLYMITKLSK